MCGIVGYIGPKDSSKVILSGLKALEYRGYDSAGVVTIAGSSSNIIKQVGRVNALEKSITEQHLPKTGLAIGHTRWATHGEPSILNAHPHFNSDKTIFVVHNGIIENYSQLKKMLEDKGYKFISQTDTEVIPHLIDYHYKQTKSFVRAFEQSLQELRGAYAIAAITTYEPSKLFAARLSSPLVLGVGKNEFVLASDPSAIMEHTKEVIYLDDYEMVEMTKDKYSIKNIKHDKSVKRSSQMLDFDLEEAQLGNFPHFMLKEIFEAPQTILSATLGRANSKTNTIKLGGLESVAQQLKYIDRIVIVACGTSYYAGLVGEYLIEELAGIPVEVQLASEFKYRDEPFSRSTALLAISQSGETADTIAAIKKVEDYGVLRIGVVNVVGSTISRITDAGVYLRAGPEQAVASTKAFVAQVTTLLLIALHLNNGTSKQFKPLLEELSVLPKKAQMVLDQADKIHKIAKKYSKARDFLYIGRRYGYPGALEGALKLKEISYIHAEGYAAGEMKHGPLAMINKDFVTFALAEDTALCEKIYSNIEEIRARKGPIIAIATEGNKEIKKLANDVIFVPKTLEQTQPIISVIAAQLFAYFMAVENGFDVDRPRNLAKSVTVE
jgi:glucosamine--fructose-6-phosphate aminotransferase (isomerizing)